MPVVDVDPDALRQLAGVPEKSESDLLDDLFALGLEFEGRTEDDELQLEFAPDRLDRLSVEGIARSLRQQYGTDRGIHQPRINPSQWSIIVDESVPDERPYVTGAIIRDISLTDSSLGSLIQLQEKLHATMGRQRVKGAIGVHDLAMIKGNQTGPDDLSVITYRGIEADAAQFVPLESDVEHTPATVLTDHPTGKAYADIVEGYESMPAIFDDLGLFSFPPIINGKRTEVTASSRDLLIELTGTDQWTIDKMLTIICYALDARGATIEAVDIQYGDHRLERPDFATKTKELTHEAIERTLGIELSGTTVTDLLERSGLDARTRETDDGLLYYVDIPAYRVDILHAVDLIDDIGRAYGFNELEPQYPEVSTVGSRHEASRFERAVRGLLVGCGFEDQLNFNLVSEESNYDRMGLSQEDDAIGGGEPARIREPYSEEYEIVRTWVLPSLMTVLENNTHRRYPQNLAEIGIAITQDDDNPTKVHERRSVGAVLARPEATYEDAKSVLDTIARRLAVPLDTAPTTHPSFIEGRTATIDFGTGPVGVIGELHPSVIVTHDVEVPVTGFEFDLAGLKEAVDDFDRNETAGE